MTISGRIATPAGVGKLCRRGSAADSSWPYVRRAWEVVCKNTQPRRGLLGRIDERLEPVKCTGLWLAHRRARMDKSQPECVQFVDGPLLSWNRHARRNYSFRGTRYHAPIGAFRRPGCRCSRAADTNGIARPGMVARLPAEELLVRTDFSQACGQALRRNPSARR